MHIGGFTVVFLSGLLCGVAPLPLKFMRRYGYEHWGFLVALLGFLALPWAALFLLCPDVPGALAAIPPRALLLGNAFSAAWGVANVLYCLCLLRIGFSLAQGILAGIAIPAGVVVPMVLKGSGRFADAPGPLSPSGLVVLGGVAVMLAAVVLVSQAGFGRDAAREADSPAARGGGGFLAGLVMGALAGVLSLGVSFSFVYTQDAVGAAFVAHGLPEEGAPAAVRVATLLGGALVNLLYPVFLLFRNRSWGVFLGRGSLRDFLLSLPIAVLTILSFALTCYGMVLLGALGASVGFGVNQAMQIVGSQSIGFLSGEWRGVPARHVRKMAAAVLLLLLAVAVVSAGMAVR